MPAYLFLDPCVLTSGYGEIMYFYNVLQQVKTFRVDNDELIYDSFSRAFTAIGCFMQWAETAEGKKEKKPAANLR